MAEPDRGGSQQFTESYLGAEGWLALPPVKSVDGAVHRDLALVERVEERWQRPDKSYPRWPLHSQPCDWEQFLLLQEQAEDRYDSIYSVMVSLGDMGEITSLQAL